MRTTPKARKILSTAAALLWAAVVATGPAQAAGSNDTRAKAAGTADQGRRNDAAFNRLDADDDGKVSRAEARAMPELHREWEGVDLNKDGYVSLQEFSGYIARTETEPGRPAKR